MAYGDYKDLPKRTAVDKVLRDKVFNIAKNSKYDGYQKGLALMFYIFFLIKSHHVVVSKIKISQTKNWLKNYTNQLLKDLKNEKYTHLLQTGY